MEKNILFKADNINKSFLGTDALKDVSIEIREGEIVGLVGENGAGKSTLLKIIMGIYQATSGKMMMHGKPYAPRNSKEANNYGIGMVFQEQSLILNLTVGQNIFFAGEKQFSKFGIINWPKMYSAAKKVLADIDIKDISPRKKVAELSFAQRQMVEIGKIMSLSRNNSFDKLLILLDEPTSVLNDEEISKLYIEMKKLKEKGSSVIFVSHRLKEVLEISDRVYVFKDGKNVGNIDIDEVDENKLYEMMVGKTCPSEYYKVDRQIKPGGNIVLKVENLGKKGVFKNVTFNLHEGEILGFCSVVGSGKEELCMVLSGDDKYSSGKMYVDNKQVNFSSPSSALSKGIISLPKERREDGILGILSVMDNISVSNLNKVKSKGFVSRGKQIRQCRSWIDKLDIKCSSYKEPIEKLSGGNAQKVLFSRILDSGAKVLILNYPTRGVDVGAKDEIYTLIRDITEKGLSIILLSDTLEEGIGLSNRIIVMKDGLITKELDASVGNKPDEVNIVKHMM